MQPAIARHLDQVLGHLYINPLEKCNLRCKICYTRKTSPILPEASIMQFLDRYTHVHKIETITFCGGEVFTLPWYTHLVNTTVDRGIFVQMITNGTVDKLSELKHPNSINLIVSIDGLKKFHDANRGKGNFDKSMSFLKKARSRGFHTEIFSIIHKGNLDHIDAFEAYLKKKLGPITVTYHPRKPPTYLMHHPISNIIGETSGFDFLTPKEMVHVMKERNVFPPKNLGCYQIALVSDGRVFGCCEGTIPIGTITDDIETLVEALRLRLVAWEQTNTLKNCLGCSQPEFMCGIKQYLSNF